MTEETRVARASAKTRLRRRLRFLRTRVRELKMIGKALVSTKHPILVHIIPMRQCNLACTYCNEFDDSSKPVPLEEMKKRLDILAGMGTSIITISGGEPLMHPELDKVIRHIRRRGMIAGLITNGFYLNKERIERLNEKSEEHPSELQSQSNLVCRLLLEKNNNISATLLAVVPSGNLVVHHQLTTHR